MLLSSIKLKKKQRKQWTNFRGKTSKAKKFTLSGVKALQNTTLTTGLTDPTSRISLETSNVITANKTVTLQEIVQNLIETVEIGKMEEAEEIDATIDATIEEAEEIDRLIDIEKDQIQEIEDIVEVIAQEGVLTVVVEVVTAKEGQEERKVDATGDDLTVVIEKEDVLIVVKNEEAGEKGLDLEKNQDELVLKLMKVKKLEKVKLKDLNHLRLVRTVKVKVRAKVIVKAKAKARARVMLKARVEVEVKACNRRNVRKNPNHNQKQNLNLSLSLSLILSRLHNPSIVKIWNRMLNSFNNKIQDPNLPTKIIIRHLKTSQLYKVLQNRN